MTITAVGWAAIALGVAHALVLLAGFVAPYDPQTQHRDHPYAPPTRMHVVDPAGRIHVQPFVYGLTFVDADRRYVEDRTRMFKVKLFVRGDDYRMGGMSFRRRLFGVDPPGRIFLLGTDGFGRDVFARLLHGGQISLFAGLAAALLAVTTGFALGGLAGYYGGVIDETVMGATELSLALPWIYALLAIRAWLPLHLGRLETFVLLVGVIGVVGWARPARLVRGVVLSARSREYVVAARACGASDLHTMWRHVMPQAADVALTQIALLVPQFVLAEVTLSFFGLGVGEPVPSWGGLLADAQRYHAFSLHWWLLLPSMALVPVFLLYNALARDLHERWTLPAA